MSAYQDAVEAINRVVAESTIHDGEARTSLAALKALIDLELEKLPADKPDYTEEENNHAKP